MFLSIVLTAVLTATPAELRPHIEAFVAGCERDDRPAVRGTQPQRNSSGTSSERLLLVDAISIDWHRIVRIEPGEKSIIVTVEMEGWATATHTGEHVPWPRWWSLEYARKPDGSLFLVTAMMSERRLGVQHAMSSPEEWERIIAAHPGFDLHMFTVMLVNEATNHDAAGCPTVLAVVRQSLIDNRPDITVAAYENLAYLAQTDPIQHDISIHWAKQTIPLAAIDRRPDAFCDAWFILAEAYRAAGLVEEAIQAFRKASTYQPEMFDPRLANRSLFHASDLEIQRNNLRQALADAEQYQKMLRPYSSQNDRMIGAHRLATIHDRLGNLEIARRYYVEARFWARDKKDPDAQATMAHSLARIAAAEGDTGEARRLLEEAKYFADRYVPDLALVTTVRTAYAARLRDDGDLALADEAFAFAFAKLDKPVPNEILSALHTERSLLRLAQGRADEALADARLARQKDAKGGAAALTAEARALRALSRMDEAETRLRDAIGVVELELSERTLDETGSAAVLGEKLVPYRELLDLLVDEGCAPEALMVAEQMRARSLRDALRNGRVDLLAGLDETKRARDQELEQAVAVANRKILAAGEGDVSDLQRERDEARLALRRFRSELYAMHPRLDRRRADDEAWRPVAAPGEVVLELAVTDSAAFLFVLHGDDVDVHRIAVSREELGKRIDAFVAALEQRDFAYRRPARALYDLLLSNAAPQLASAKTVRIVPDGALWRLPFHALIDAGGKHLIERLPVAYSPSLALTRMPARRAGTQRTLLAFADPSIGSGTVSATRSLYRDVTLGRLPEAATEARAIARIYGDATVRVGAEAQESAFKKAAPAFRVLHLATHSIVDDGAPMFSSIVLAASEANPLEDGLLEAREIADLDLGADLAVLSACETAGGAVTAGEGMIGLSWAFLAAGVPTTVVSQWKVGSASTADLMIAFHRKLRDGGDPAVALRSAMLELRRDSRWAHPFYWAPFVVIENSGSPSERQ